MMLTLVFLFCLQASHNDSSANVSLKRSYLNIFLRFEETNGQFSTYEIGLAWLLLQCYLVYLS